MTPTATADNPYLIGMDWQVDWFTPVDGDTCRVRRFRLLGLADGMLARIYDDPAQLPTGLPVRAINLDTPELHSSDPAERVLAKRARADAEAWLAAALSGPGLSVQTWGGQGGFDRLLGDFYVTGDRSNTLTAWMLRYGNNGAGWPPYVRGQ